MVKNILALCGSTLGALSALFIIIAFSTSHWLESYQEANSRFAHLGLWEACFNKFGYDRDSLGKVYDGCNWVFSYDYRPIFDWLNPSWMLAVQVMMTLTLILSLIAAVLCLIGLLGFCPPTRATTAQLINSIFMFCCALLLTISIITFGVKSDIDRQWLPRPEQNYLSWSFGLCVVAGFFSIFSGMCLLVDFLRMKNISRRSRIPPPYIGYKMQNACSRC